MHGPVLRDVFPVELVRLLIIALQDQQVSVGVSVEVAIGSVLHEVIVSGVLEADWRQILAVCLSVATAALRLVVRVRLPPTVAGVDSEAQVSARRGSVPRWTDGGLTRHRRRHARHLGDRAHIVH
ncbi:MAG: hypothetical protein WBN89_11540, partial [Prochlorococcaceae cyanobacterium]